VSPSNLDKAPRELAEINRKAPAIKLSAPKFRSQKCGRFPPRPRGAMSTKATSSQVAVEFARDIRDFAMSLTPGQAFDAI